MGGGELFELTDLNALHREIEFPAIGIPTFTAWPHGAHGAQLPPLQGGLDPLQVRVTDVEMADEPSGGFRQAGG